MLFRSCTTARFAIKLLEDLVFFVVDQTSSGQPVLEVVMTKANRERQKLMREQNILKQVGTTSTTTTSAPGSLTVARLLEHPVG